MYRLTRKAEDDLIEIYVDGAAQFGRAQAEAYLAALESVFEIIAANPLLAAEREEISPPVRVHPHGSHIVIYLVDDAGDILIVRVRHAREDWMRDPT